MRTVHCSDDPQHSAENNLGVHIAMPRKRKNAQDQQIDVSAILSEIAQQQSSQPQEPWMPFAIYGRQPFTENIWVCRDVDFEAQAIVYSALRVYTEGGYAALYEYSQLVYQMITSDPTIWVKPPRQEAKDED